MYPPAHLGFCIEHVHLFYVVRPYASTLNNLDILHSTGCRDLSYMYAHICTCTCTVRIYESPLDRGHIPEAAMNGLCKKQPCYDVAYTTAQLTETSEPYKFTSSGFTTIHTYVYILNTYLHTCTHYTRYMQHAVITCLINHVRSTTWSRGATEKPALASTKFGKTALIS